MLIARFNCKCSNNENRIDAVITKIPNRKKQTRAQKGKVYAEVSND